MYNSSQPKGYKMSYISGGLFKKGFMNASFQRSLFNESFSVVKIETLKTKLKTQIELNENKKFLLFKNLSCFVEFKQSFSFSDDCKFHEKEIYDFKLSSLFYNKTIINNYLNLTKNSSTELQFAFVSDKNNHCIRIVDFKNKIIIK